MCGSVEISCSFFFCFLSVWILKKREGSDKQVNLNNAESKNIERKNIESKERNIYISSFSFDILPFDVFTFGIIQVMQFGYFTNVM